MMIAGFVACYLGFVADGVDAGGSATPGPLVEEDFKVNGKALKVNVMDIVVYYIHTS